MGRISILTENELRKTVALDMDALACIENCFKALAGGGVIMPPILRLDIAEYNGEVDVKTAYVPGLKSFAIKISPGFFDNHRLGLPSLNELMILFSAETGLVEALLLDNGYLTAVRTAAAGAAAARHLSREDAKSAAILGAGEQGKLQLEAVTLVREITEARYWSPHKERVFETAKQMQKKLDIEVHSTTTPQEAVHGADIIITCTPSTTPVLMADWLEPGQHITAMGSDSEHKNELDPKIITLAESYVPDNLQQVSRLGELHHAIRAGLVDEKATFNELGSVISGKAAGRKTPADITVVDLTGTGVQDTAIATFARERALNKDTGLTIPT